MQATTEAKAVHHDWERVAGSAPYRLVGCFSIPHPGTFGDNLAGYQNALRELGEMQRALGVHGGACDICGHPLVANYVLENADGRRFVVGCDCVTRSGDTRLTTTVEEAERDRQRKLRQARQRAEWAAKQAAREAKERAENGGNTLDEIHAERVREAAQKAAQRAVKAAADNAWLVQVLEGVPTTGDFIPSMISTLQREPAADLSRRCLEILGDIYATAVSGKRRGTKAWNAARDEFDAKIDAQ